MSKLMPAFHRIGIMGRQRRDSIGDTLLALKVYLQSRNFSLCVEAETAHFFPGNEIPICAREELSQHCDLLIVVGGDGSLLNAAHAAVEQNLPVIGVNRGRLGFLTDINPREVAHKIGAILEGHYFEEQRFLLSATVLEHDQVVASGIALNDVVITIGEVVHMIEYAIDINDQFVCNQRSDGIIVTTPTGSTAYALSAGGPILHPQLDAVALVPMYPHTLSARPVVVAGNSEIKITISKNNESSPRISCDGQTLTLIPLGAQVTIAKKQQHLRLIHPLDYNYYKALRSKLHWNLEL